MGIGAHAPGAPGASAASSGRSGRRRRTAPPGDSSASILELAQCSGLSAIPASGTWWDRQDPSVFLPSTSAGPVHPFGVTRTIIGQRGRSVRPPVPAAAWIARISSTMPSERRRHRLVHRARLVPPSTMHGR